MERLFKFAFCFAFYIFNLKIIQIPQKSQKTPQMEKNAPHALCSSAPSNQTLPQKNLPLKNPRIKNFAPKVHPCCLILSENAFSMDKSKKIPAFKGFAPENPLQVSDLLLWCEFFLPIFSLVLVSGLQSIPLRPCYRGRVLQRGSLQWGQCFGWGARPPPWPLLSCTTAYLPDLRCDDTTRSEQTWPILPSSRFAFASGRDGQEQKTKILGGRFFRSPFEYPPKGPFEYPRKGQTQVIIGEIPSMVEIPNAEVAGGSKMVCNISGVHLAYSFSSVRCLCDISVGLTSESAGQTKICCIP